jgi:hypothetical protein
MTTTRLSRLLLGAALMSLAPLAPAHADGPVAQGTAAEEAASFEADRAAILAMAGNYRVTFDMRETTSWRNDYTPLEPKMSGGFESVRVIEDSGRHIVLQHLLVVGTEESPVVVKHWRQDWTYEPETYLAYVGEGRWDVVAVPERMRAGRWSQTVWQVDDSPRYGGWGEWTETGGVPRWRSNWTLRPLARRDAVREPVYDRYLSINRHSPSPAGWIHWQDNIKQGVVDGEVVPFVQETVLNTYAHSEDYDPAPADEYWAATQGYWAAVRAAWDEAIAADNGVTLTEEPSMGNTLSATLYGLALEIASGDRDEASAIAEARETIRTGTGGEATASD